jgi:mono/diheme cytochrome c family protein
MSADRHMVMRTPSALPANRAGLCAIFCLAATVSAPFAHAQATGADVRGRALSEAWCSSCHLVSAGNRPTANDGAPTFQAIARHTSTTSTGLRVFLQTPHPRMPNDVLSAAQTDDIVAYILSLKH